MTKIAVEGIIGILFIVAFIFEEPIALWERKQLKKIKRFLKKRSAKKVSTAPFGK